MKIYKCPKCNSQNVFTDEVADEIGLYCKDCRQWIKWLNKSEAKAINKQIKKMQKDAAERTINDI